MRGQWLRQQQKQKKEGQDIKIYFYSFWEFSSLGRKSINSSIEVSHLSNIWYIKHSH